MKTISLKIEKELQQRIEEKAGELNLDTNDLIVKALKDFLYLERVKQLREQLSEKVKKMGYDSEEDIFDEIS